MRTSPIRTFKTGEYTVTRTPGSYIAGAWVDGTPVTTNDVVMSIQPTDDSQLLKFAPNGCTTEDIRYVLTELQLKNRDEVGYKSEQWVVFKVKDWDDRGATWVEAWMARKNLGVLTS